MMRMHIDSINRDKFLQGNAIDLGYELVDCASLAGAARERTGGTSGYGGNPDIYLRGQQFFALKQICILSVEFAGEAQK